MRFVEILSCVRMSKEQEACFGIIPSNDENKTKLLDPETTQIPSGIGDTPASTPQAVPWFSIVSKMSRQLGRRAGSSSTARRYVPPMLSMKPVDSSRSLSGAVTWLMDPRRLRLGKMRAVSRRVGPSRITAKCMNDGFRRALRALQLQILWWLFVASTSWNANPGAYGAVRNVTRPDGAFGRVSG